jgi:hypothetical protein
VKEGLKDLFEGELNPMIESMIQEQMIGKNGEDLKELMKNQCTDFVNILFEPFDVIHNDYMERED